MWGRIKCLFGFHAWRLFFLDFDRRGRAIGEYDCLRCGAAHTEFQKGPR